MSHLILVCFGLFFIANFILAYKTGQLFKTLSPENREKVRANNARFDPRNFLFFGLLVIPLVILYSRQSGLLNRLEFLLVYAGVWMVCAYLDSIRRSKKLSDLELPPTYVSAIRTLLFLQGVTFPVFFVGVRMLSGTVRFL